MSAPQAAAGTVVVSVPADVPLARLWGRVAPQALPLRPVPGTVLGTVTVEVPRRHVRRLARAVPAVLL